MLVEYLSLAETLVDSSYGWIVVLLFFAWEFYCPLPFHETKIQQYFDNYSDEIAKLREDHIDTRDRLAEIAHQQQRSIRILRAVVRETDGVEDHLASQYLVDHDFPVSHFQEDPSDEDITMDKQEYTDGDDSRGVNGDD